MNPSSMFFLVLIFLLGSCQADRGKEKSWELSVVAQLKKIDSGEGVKRFDETFHFYKKEDRDDDGDPSFVWVLPVKEGLRLAQIVDSTKGGLAVFKVGGKEYEIQFHLDETGHFPVNYAGEGFVHWATTRNSESPFKM
ncbi:MAG TPA: hypothetical protein ENK02_16075 [Planctomycetes bacterium]|nr:hypothetical protein [Planctomycetota bacterium]